MIYRFFQHHRPLLWILIVSTSILFAVFASQLRFEEDIVKLLPQTNFSKENELAFDQMAIKDKLFIQITTTLGSDATPDMLAQAADDFVDSLLIADSASHLISHTLYRIEDDWVVNAIDYAVAQFPTLMDSSIYPALDTLLTPSALDRQMSENAKIIDADMDGTTTSMLSYDPAGLRYALLPQLDGMDQSLGFSVVDGHLMSPDSTVSMIFVTPAFTSSNSADCGKLVKLVDKITSQWQPEHDGLEVLTHGIVVTSAGNSHQIKKDLVTTVLFSILLILIVLVICLGHRSSWQHIILPVLYGTVFGMACMYWIKGTMSLMAMGVSALVLGIAISYVLHVVVHHKYLNDPERVVREQTVPLCLSCLTTVGAFLSLLFTNSELLADFGLFSSLALIGTTFCSLVFLPQFLNSANSRHNERAFHFLDRIASIQLDRKPAIVVIFVIICIGAFIASPKVKFDNDLNNIGYVSEENARSQKLYNDKVNQSYQSVYYAATATRLEEAMRYSRTLDSVLTVQQQTGLCHSHGSISRFCLTCDEQQHNIDNWKKYWTPQRCATAQHNIAVAAQKHGLDPAIFDAFTALTEADYTPDLILENEVIPKEISCNLVEKIDSNYVLFTSALTTATQADSLSDIISQLPGVIVCDPFYYTDSMVDIVHHNFNIVMYISMIFVFIVLLLSLRNIKLTLLAFLPMFVSWYVVQGIMALLGIEFNLVNIILSSFIFGVGVDYSIFTVNGLVAQQRGNNPELLAHHRTAIILSAFILVVVSISLLFATHPAINSVGGCTLIGMLSAILLSACFQPFLFRKFCKANKQKQAH